MDIWHLRTPHMRCNTRSGAACRKHAQHAAQFSAAASAAFAGRRRKTGVAAPAQVMGAARHAWQAAVRPRAVGVTATAASQRNGCPRSGRRQEAAGTAAKRQAALGGAQAASAAAARSRGQRCHRKVAVALQPPASRHTCRLMVRKIMFRSRYLQHGAFIHHTHCSARMSKRHVVPCAIQHQQHLVPARLR